MRMEKQPYKLWYLPLAIKVDEEQVGEYKNNLVNNFYKNKTYAEVSIFLHATCFRPIKSTLSKTVKNGIFSTWPRLILELISTHLPKSEASLFGNLDKTRNNIR